MKNVNHLPRASHTYLVFHRRTGKHYSETSAVSPAKAISNVWWNNIKHRNPFIVPSVRPIDLDAVEINN